ncbi:zinc ABC transporter substrate-binding protein ZnuA [Vibrio sp. Isolate31]|uniref:zinc ABC transporter substrate-binding protein ZnuA n=1 Tax=unclassified Vibrio TaxID=2614977 RepID=UPI001EFE649F|nr:MULTISPECIES: zinc ABC transporter substrate-binding protein ZnuA [unclassified Vibrio]MCG9553336.1 zinc ABC transporter substrate-binding protein ZnuA [Vibrio sp. Isolate32]MCG9601254.1 zinc ABC transporter substrate-binding protein ZnuA [Vibrio sp. Isolate31]
MSRSSYILATLLLAPSVASANTILTSFKPIQMIVTELTQGVSEPDVLMNSNASPHDYALKPSDVKKVHGADMVVWFGPDLEAFLTKVIESNNNVIEIGKIPGINLREFGHDEHDHDAHEGHHHGSHDPHFWLGIDQVAVAAKYISDKLIETDPDNAMAYQENLDSFLIALEEKKQSIREQLASVKDKGYYVFHDAYGYYEEEFGLNNLGHFTVSPERKPGAKSLIAIKKTIVRENVQCVFSEPQFTPAVIESVTRGSHAKQGQLDPIGSTVEVKSGSYFDFLQQLTDSYTSCLSTK